MSESIDLFSLLQFPEDSPPTLSPEEVRNELNSFAEGQFKFDIPPGDFDPTSAKSGSHFQTLSMDRMGNVTTIPSKPPADTSSGTTVSALVQQAHKNGKLESAAFAAPSKDQSFTTTAIPPQPHHSLTQKWDPSSPIQSIVVPSVVNNPAAPLSLSSAYNQTFLQQPIPQQQQQHQQPQLNSANLSTYTPYRYPVPTPNLVSSSTLPNPIIISTKETPLVQITPTVPANEPYPSESDAPVSPAEDKRKRNTAASARFRLRKKAKLEALEVTARDMTLKAETLSKLVRELETEVSWLRGLLIGRDGPSKVQLLTEMYNKNRDFILGLTDGAALATSTPSQSV